jgi:hypothetical protein
MALFARWTAKNIYIEFETMVLVERTEEETPRLLGAAEIEKKSIPLFIISLPEKNIQI